MAVNPTMMQDDFTDKYYHEDNPHNKHLFNPETVNNRIYANSRSVNSLNHSALPASTGRHVYGTQDSQLGEYMDNSHSFRAGNQSQNSIQMTQPDVELNSDLNSSALKEGLKSQRSPERR